MPLFATLPPCVNVSRSATVCLHWEDGIGLITLHMPWCGALLSTGPVIHAGARDQGKHKLCLGKQMTNDFFLCEDRLSIGQSNVSL